MLGAAKTGSGKTLAFLVPVSKIYLFDIFVSSLPVAVVNLGLARSGWLTFEVLRKQLTSPSFGRDDKLGSLAFAGEKAPGLFQACKSNVKFLT